MKELLDMKKRMDARRPKFIRQDAHKWKRLGCKWRKPVGIHSKVRQKIIGHPVMVNMGYRTPSAVRGLMRTGLEAVRVFTEADIRRLDGKKQVALIASSVGKRKRLVLVAAAQKQGLSILHINDPAKYIEDIKKSIEDAKKARAERLKAKTEKKEEPKKAKSRKEATKDSASEGKKPEEAGGSKAKLEEKMAKPDAGLEDAKEAERREAEKAMIKP